MTKHFPTLILAFFCWGLLQGCSGDESSTMRLHLNEPGYEKLVDFLYAYAKEHRLDLSWHGWYQVDHATHWYERSNEKSDLIIKIYPINEGYGHILISSHPDESIANVVVTYSDYEYYWVDTMNDFEQAVASRDWRLEPVE